MSDTPTPAGAGNEAQVTAVVAKTSTSTRKEPRLPLEFPVLVRYEDSDGEMVRCNCKTVSVSVNGALLALDGTYNLTVGQSLKVGQILRLTNVKTGQEVECTVRSVGQKERANHVGIVFTAWSPEFWEIIFPRQEGDPPPNQQPTGVCPLKPFFGRVGPMPANAQDEAAPDSTVEGPAEQPSVAGTLGNRISGNKKAMMVFIVLVLLVSTDVWMLVRPSNDQSTSATGADSTAFVLPPQVAQVVPNPAGFRLAMAGDFAPEAAGLLGSLGQTVSGEIDGNFGGTGKSWAYVMMRSDKSWRVAIVVDGQVRCDARYQAVAIAARVPVGLVRRITWSSPLSAEPEGDGLLIVRSSGQMDSAVVLFLRGSDVISGTPADYKEFPALQMP